MKRRSALFWVDLVQRGSEPLAASGGSDPRSAPAQWGLAALNPGGLIDVRHRFEPSARAASARLGWLSAVGSRHSSSTGPAFLSLEDSATCTHHLAAALLRNR